MESELFEARRLIMEAVSGPPGTAEITTASGRIMRVERDPEPGIELRLQAVPEQESADWLVLSVTPVAARPELYPPSVPFVPDAQAIVAVFGDTSTVSWSLARAPACPALSIEPDAQLEGLARKLESVRQEVREGDAAARAEAGERVKAIFDSLDADTKARLEALWQQLKPEEAALGYLEQIFEAVTGASVNEGWEVVESKDTQTPIRTSSARLERGAQARRVLMMTMFGAGSSVILIDGPRESGAAA